MSDKILSKELKITKHQLENIKLLCTNVDYDLDDIEVFQDKIEKASISLQRFFDFDTNDIKNKYAKYEVSNDK